MSGIDGPQEARVRAALDQLLASLSEISGRRLGTPIVFACRDLNTGGLGLFNVDIDVEHLADALRTFADMADRADPSTRIDNHTE